jgi:Cys-Gly metallodipeptidase DUG1
VGVFSQSFLSNVGEYADNLNSIPVTLTFEQATGKNVLLLPMGSSTDAAHSINEKLDKKNYIEGIKLLGAYLHYVAEEPMVTQ